MLLRLEILYSGYSLFVYFLRQIWPFIIFAVFLRPTVFYFTGIYKQLWRYASGRDLIRLAESILLGSVILTVDDHSHHLSFMDENISALVIDP